ncbi:MAG: hypothetical protein FD123_4412, partial [Bacteroidetes bacterium]
KWAMPVLSAGASTFISEAAAAHSRGENMSDAAKSALKPTVGAVIDAIGKKITDGTKSPKQGGSGHRRKKTKRKATKQKPVYKGIQKGGKSKRKRKHKSKGKSPVAKAPRKRKVKKAKRKVKKAKRSKANSSENKSTPYNF